jgi:hypothetical protein
MPTNGYPLPFGVRGRAEFSGDGQYRYWLERRWNDSLTHFTYILLNPSSASATEDDGTTRKLFEITQANGGGSYELVNIFALVDTAQTCLRDPVAVGETHQANDWWPDGETGCPTIQRVEGDRRQSSNGRAKSCP